MKKFVLVTMMVVLVLMSVADAKATTRDGHRFGIGLQMLPGTIDGVSFTWDISDKYVVVNPMIDFGADAFGGEIRYAFLREKRYDLFVGPMVAAGGDDVDFGGAFGVDWDWRGLDSGLPPISWNLQIGLAAEAGFGVGVGIHYVFGH